MELVKRKHKAVIEMGKNTSSQLCCGPDVSLSGSPRGAGRRGSVLCWIQWATRALHRRPQEMTTEWEGYNVHLRFSALTVSVLPLGGETTQPGSVMELNLLWLIFLLFSVR